MNDQPDPILFDTSPSSDNGETTSEPVSATGDAAEGWRSGMYPADHDYFGPDADSVVIRSQDAIAVYLNSWGEIVIRRERAWDEDEDVCIRVSPENLPRLIAALQRYLR